MGFARPSTPYIIWKFALQCGHTIFDQKYQKHVRTKRYLQVIIILLIWFQEFFLINFTNFLINFTKFYIYSFGRVTAILCFQHEVALRMCAPPNTPERCRLSVICQNWADVHYKHMLPGGAFTPPPEVDVGIVRLNPLRYFTLWK